MQERHIEHTLDTKHIIHPTDDEVDEKKTPHTIRECKWESCMNGVNEKYIESIERHIVKCKVHPLYNDDWCYGNNTSSSSTITKSIFRQEAKQSDSIVIVCGPPVLFVCHTNQML